MLNRPPGCEFDTDEGPMACARPTPARGAVAGQILPALQQAPTAAHWL